MQRYYIKKAVLFFSLLLPSFGALPFTTVWEVRPTNGNTLNGGCFDSAKVGTGTDYSQQNTVQYTFTNLASSNGSTSPSTITSASHNFVTADVGNCLHISAGTNWTTGWYEIVSVAANAATVDRAVGSVASLTSGTFYVGGALDTIPHVILQATGGNIYWVKAEATISTAANISINPPSSGTGAFPAIIGYTSVRADGGKVTIQASTSSVNSALLIGTAGIAVINFTIDCNSQANTGGVLFNALNDRAINVDVKNCISNPAFTFANNYNGCINCTATNISSSTNGAMYFENGGYAYCYFCVAVGNSVTGINASGNAPGWACVFCISGNNSGATSDGITVGDSQGAVQLINSVAYGNGRDGIRINTSSSPYGYTLFNNISYGNAAYGIDYTGSGTLTAGALMLDYNAYGGNTTANLNLAPAGPHDVTLSSSPFVNGASNNFALSAGGITAVGGKGFPGVLTLGGTGNNSIGALMPAASSASQHGYPILQ